MHNNGLGPEGAKKFANALDKCYQKSSGKLGLKVLVCGRNRLEYEGSKAISGVLKQMGTLEEIQMPQNGIRPNGIEFLAEACANNPNLRVVNFNDNTFRKIGCDQMAKALINLKKLEYLNLGDCLLGGKGALIITRALVNLPILKEVIISFNEINLQSGLEISQLLMKRKEKTLSMVDLNGNRFGEDGKMDILQILEPVKDYVASLSEDEGSDEEDEEEVEGDEEEEEDEEEDEEETSEVVVDDEYDDYDQVENHEYEEYEDEEGGEEDDDEEEEEALEGKFGNFNLAQQQKSLFTNFKTESPNTPTTKQAINLFSNMVRNNKLMLSNPQFDAFISNPSIANLKVIDQNTLIDITKVFLKPGTKKK